MDVVAGDGWEELGRGEGKGGRGNFDRNVKTNNK